jgi:hypothetical protein
LQQQLGAHLIGAIPVCTAPEREYGVQDRLLPAMVELFGEARGVAFLRCLHAEADAGKMRKVWRQLLEVGKLAAREAWTRAQKK